MTQQDQAQVPRDRRALVAIDLGAESCRVSLLRWIDERPVVRLVHRFANAPRATAKGLQWDLAAMEAGVEQGLRHAAAIATEGIRSIAVDGWAVDYVRLDADGVAVADPFCYRDERTVQAEAELHRRISPERMRTLTGVQLSRINSAYQLFADAEELKPLRWLNLPEYTLARLGGRPVAEITNASHSQLVDLTTRTWSHEILHAAAIPITTVPELVPPGTVLGHLAGPLAELPAFADTLLIAPACHDTASAIAGIPAQGDDWAYISSGTWSLVGTLADKPCNGPEARADNFTNLAAAAGRTLFHKNINGMWILRQCLEQWEAEGATWAVPDLIAAAEKVPATDALLDVDDPELLLPGDMPGRINRQLSARELPVQDTSASSAPAFANLIFRSLAARYADVLARVSAHSGKTLRRIYIVGGASQNNFLNRLTQEVSGIEVVKASTESSTIGNFAVQLSALEPETTAGFPGEIARWSRLLAEA
jgi:rhamnulokinase